MFNIIIKAIAALIMLLGVTVIYDSRIITKKFFGFGDQNDATDGLKVLGFMVTVGGALIFYFNI